MDFINWCNQNQGFIMVVLTVVYVVATVLITWFTHENTKVAQRQLELATKLEADRVRPYILFDIITRKNCLEAVIRNTGLTSARDVHITISPDLTPALDVMLKEVHPIPFIKKGVTMMAPGRDLSAFLGAWHKFKDAYPDLKFAGSVEYKDTQGNSYSERFDIDLNGEVGLLTRNLKDIDDVGTSLKNIETTLEGISRGARIPLVRTVTNTKWTRDERAEWKQLMKELAEEQEPETEQTINNPQKEKSEP